MFLRKPRRPPGVSHWKAPLLTIPAAVVGWQSEGRVYLQPQGSVLNAPRVAFMPRCCSFSVPLLFHPFSPPATFVFLYLWLPLTHYFFHVFTTAGYLFPEWILQFLLLSVVCFPSWVPGKTCSESTVTHQYRAATFGRLPCLMPCRGCWLSSHLIYWRRLLGQGWSLGPEPEVIYAHEWILWLSECIMHCPAYGGNAKQKVSCKGQRAVFLQARKGAERSTICV